MIGGGGGGDADEFVYELQGVLAHSGVAQGGHYYSFIKERDERGQWYQFNDTKVEP